MSKAFTLLWGVFCIGFAFLVKDLAPTVIESINKIGSAIYGPVLAVFFAGVFIKKAKPSAAILGLAGGVATNIFLWLFVPSVSWLWWNAIGFFLALLLITIGSPILDPSFEFPPPIKIPPQKISWKIISILLAVYSAVLVFFLVLFPKLFYH